MAVDATDLEGAGRAAEVVVEEEEGDGMAVMAMGMDSMERCRAAGAFRWRNRENDEVDTEGREVVHK
jgi:hypothetical protein